MAKDKKEVYGSVNATFDYRDFEKIQKDLEKYFSHSGYTFSTSTIPATIKSKWTHKPITIKDVEMNTVKTGVFFNNKVYLYEPFQYKGVFTTPEIPRGLSLKNSSIYDFTLRVVGANKPEIIKADYTSDIAKNTPFTITIEGQSIASFNHSGLNETELRSIERLMETAIFDTLEKAKDFVKDSQVDGGKRKVVKSFTDLAGAIKLIDGLNNPEYHHVFGLQPDVSKTVNKPKVDGQFINNFYLQGNVVKLLSPIEQAFANKERFALLFTGEAGYGKTTAFQAIAEHLKKQYLYVNCAVMQNTTDWFGQMEAKDGNTDFVLTDFTKYLKKGNCVIVLDEFNRLPIEVANSLLPIMDDRGEITVKGKTIKAGNGILFGITLNEGIEYTGIGGMLDKAIKSRIYGKVEIVPLPENIENEVLQKVAPNVEQEIIETLVKIANEMRSVIVEQRNEGNFITADISTRATKQVAWWLDKGLDISDALEYTIFSFISDDEMTTFVDRLKIYGVM